VGGEPVKVRAGAKTDVGRLRERNEDAFLIREPLFAVADGMGGHRGGDVASSLTLEVIGSSLDGSEQTGEGAGPQAEARAGTLTALVDEIKKANRTVLERGEADGALRGMGTTLTGILAEAGRAHVFHVGDSRAYLFRDGSLQQLTEDHTLVQRMVREGRLQPEEAEGHPQRSILTRALGVDDDLEVDQLTLDVHPGDRLLLCTDGLTTMVPKEEIQEILKTEEDPQRACDRLVEAANRGGGDDNITAVVMDFVEERDGSAGRPAAGPPGVTGAPTVSGEPPPEPRPEPERERGTSRRRSIRWRVAAWAALLVAVVAAGLVGMRFYIDGQWYVADYNGRVTIYNGIPTEVLGFELSRVEQSTDLSTSQASRLGPWKELEDGITTETLEDARAIVDQIRQDLQESVSEPGGER
jgi:PPM family protein phosphatase